MLETFSALFGPYPFDDVHGGRHRRPPRDPAGVADPVRPSAPTTSVRIWDNQRLIAHELAHQWFGNTVTAASLRDIWLHEGFACYAEWLWSETIGRTTAQEEAERHHALLARLPQDLVLTDPGPHHTFDDRVYKRGALTLHTLRRAVGDDLFFAVLRAWVDIHRYGVVTTADFEELVRDETGGRPRAPARPVAARARPAAAGPRPRDGPLMWVKTVAQPTVFTHARSATTPSTTSTRGPSTHRPRTADARPRARSRRPPSPRPVNAPAGDRSTRTASCPITAPVSGYHAL